jgi:hypothetical protein
MWRDLTQSASVDIMCSWPLSAEIDVGPAIIEFPDWRQMDGEMGLTWSPALAECDFWDFVAASLGPAFPPTDLPLPPAISRLMIS